MSAATSFPRSSTRPERSGADGLGGALLRRILLPPAGDLADGAEGDLQRARPQAAHEGSARIHGAAGTRARSSSRSSGSSTRQFRPMPATKNRRTRRLAKTRLFTVLTILSNVAGNSFLTRGMHQLGDVGNSPLALIAALFHPLGGAGRGAADCLDPYAHGAAELGRSELCDAGDCDQLRGDRHSRRGYSWVKWCRPRAGPASCWSPPG